MPRARDNDSCARVSGCRVNRVPLNRPLKTISRRQDEGEEESGRTLESARGSLSPAANEGARGPPALWPPLRSVARAREFDLAVNLGTNQRYRRLPIALLAGVQRGPSTSTCICTSASYAPPPAGRRLVARFLSPASFRVNGSFAPNLPPSHRRAPSVFPSARSACCQLNPSSSQLLSPTLIFLLSPSSPSTVDRRPSPLAHRPSTVDGVASSPFGPNFNFNFGAVGAANRKQLKNRIVLFFFARHEQADQFFCSPLRVCERIRGVN